MPSANAQLRIQANRQARYFAFPPTPYAESLANSYESDGSTWAFVSRPSSSLVEESVASDATCVSAAQQIVQRYRAGLSIELNDRKTPTVPRSARPVKSTPLPLADNSSPGPLVRWPVTAEPTELPSNFVAREVKPTFRQSRYDAMDEFRQEAYQIMVQSNAGENEPLVCRNCHDTVNDVSALACHLHIHAIHDRSHECDQCHESFETLRELRMHRCQMAQSPPLSPLKEGFRRALRRLSLCK